MHGGMEDYAEASTATDRYRESPTDRERLLSNMDSFETCEIVVPDASRPIIKAARALQVSSTAVSNQPQPQRQTAVLRLPHIAELDKIQVDNFRLHSPRENLFLLEKFPS